METVTNFLPFLPFLAGLLLAWTVTLAYYQDKERREARTRAQKADAWGKAIEEAQQEARKAWDTANKYSRTCEGYRNEAKHWCEAFEREADKAERWRNETTIRTKALRRSNAIAKAARERAAEFQRLAWRAIQAFDCIAATLEEHEKQLNNAPPLEERQGRPPIEGPAHPQEGPQEARGADPATGAGQGAGDPGNGPQGGQVPLSEGTPEGGPVRPQG